MQTGGGIKQTIESTCVWVSRCKPPLLCVMCTEQKHPFAPTDAPSRKERGKWKYGSARSLTLHIICESAVGGTPEEPLCQARGRERKIITIKKAKEAAARPPTRLSFSPRVLFQVSIAFKDTFLGYFSFVLAPGAWPTAKIPPPPNSPSLCDTAAHIYWAPKRSPDIKIGIFIAHSPSTPLVAHWLWRLESQKVAFLHSTLICANSWKA